MLFCFPIRFVQSSRLSCALLLLPSEFPTKMLYERICSLRLKCSPFVGMEQDIDMRDDMPFAKRQGQGTFIFYSTQHPAAVVVAVRLSSDQLLLPSPPVVHSPVITTYSTQQVRKKSRHFVVPRNPLAREVREPNGVRCVSLQIHIPKSLPSQLFDQRQISAGITVDALHLYKVNN